MSNENENEHEIEYLRMELDRARKKIIELEEQKREMIREMRKIGGN
jgi:low affinity Fe/Cu permease